MKAIADEIEREIAEHYMELPLDADGVPIRVGDVTTHGIVKALHFDGKLWSFSNENDVISFTKHTVHVKPDPIKELLKEFAEIGIRIGASEPIPANLHMYPDKEVIDEFVKRIRQAVES